MTSVARNRNKAIRSNKLKPMIEGLRDNPMTMPELCEAFGISRPTMYNYIKEGYFIKIEGIFPPKYITADIKLPDPADPTQTLRGSDKVILLPQMSEEDLKTVYDHIQEVGDGVIPLRRLINSGDFDNLESACINALVLTRYLRQLAKEGNI